MKNINRQCSFFVFSFFIIFTFFTLPAFAGQWKVKSGDSLSRIAANYPGVTAGEICKANTFMFKIKGCNHIEPGWNLVIPNVGDCFDATMTTASKHKIIDRWNKKVVSNYKDGKPDCNFSELSKKPVMSTSINITKLKTGNEDLLYHIEVISNTLDNYVNSKVDVFTFITLGNGGKVGVGGLLKSPSDYALSYQFSGNKKGYSNQLLVGKYFTSNLAVIAGPRAENNDSVNYDSVGVKIALLYTPKITNSFFGYIELSASTMRVKRYQENGTPELSLNGNILSVNISTERKESNYWDRNLNISVGVAYKF